MMQFDKSELEGLGEDGCGERCGESAMILNLWIIDLHDEWLMKGGSFSLEVLHLPTKREGIIHRRHVLILSLSLLLFESFLSLKQSLQTRGHYDGIFRNRNTFHEAFAYFF
jgi:hypothetical protein